MYDENMRRSNLSLVTAVLSLLGAVAWLAFGNAAAGLLWIAISIGWLVTAIVQRIRPAQLEPLPAPKLRRRFLRLFLYWS
jgi:hypothetical protein